MNDRPAPPLQARRYRCAVHAQPIRISTVRYACTYSLRVSRDVRRPRYCVHGRHCRAAPRHICAAQRSNPACRTQTRVVARRALLLIERNILMILFRHRVPVTCGHRATIDRTVDLLLPGHPGWFLFLRRRLLFGSRVFRSRVFRSLGFRRGRGSCRRRGSAARRALRQRDAGRQG